MKNEKSVEKNKNAGHRGRLRDRFLQDGLGGFLDYEIIELLLTLGTPRKDCKETAKEAIKKFYSMNNVLDATIEELQQVRGIGPSNAFGIKLFSAISEKYTKEKINSKIFFDSPAEIAEFLKEKIGKEQKENFVILYFGSKNNLILDEISVGTLNASVVHPREVFSKAIINHASHVILAHNHPSNNSSPSQDDFITTERLVEAGKIIGITVVDHIIVGKNNYYSFKENGKI